MLINKKVGYFIVLLFIVVLIMALFRMYNMQKQNIKNDTDVPWGANILAHLL